MTALLRSSSSSGFSESLQSDTLSEDPILESYPQTSEIEVERYHDYSYSHDEHPDQETIVITAPPWGTDEEEPVSIIIDEDLNHISLDAKSQSNFSYSQDHFTTLNRASSSNKEIHDTYEIRLKADDASTDLVTISSHDAVTDVVHKDVNEESGQVASKASSNIAGILEASLKRQSKGKGKRQATSDIEEDSDIEDRRYTCKERGGSSSVTLAGWQQKFNHKKKEKEIQQESRCKIILPSRRRAAARAYQRDTKDRSLILWEKLVNLPISRDARERSVWPIWLHPAFRVESDDHMERLNVKELDDFLQNILDSERHYIAFRNVFEATYGPMICYGRIEEMYETVRAVGIIYRVEELAEQYCNPDFAVADPLETLHCDDLFTPRFIGNFNSFVAFQQHDEETRQVLPPEVYQAHNARMLNWYRGTGNVDDYLLWGLARILFLEQHEERALDPHDLLSSDLREWQQRLNHCLTHEDAVTVTEEYFGPLSQIDQYETPRIDIDKLWSPCQCNVCVRSRKRVKTEHEK